jgi:hypothetical protein
MTPHWNKWAPLNTAVTAKTDVTVLTEYPNCCAVTDVDIVDIFVNCIWVNTRWQWFVHI